MQHVRIALSCLFLLCLVTACGVSDEAEEIAALKGDAAAGAMLYQSNCASCHGQDAMGGSYDVDLVAHAAHHDDADFAQIILEGRGDMPGFETRLEAQQIADIIAHLRSL